MKNNELQNSSDFTQDNLTDTSEDYSEDCFDDDAYEEAIEYTDEEFEKIEVLEISDEEAEDEPMSETQTEEEESKEQEKEPEEATVKKASKKGNFIFSLLIAVFCLIIFGVGAANLIAEDRDFSENENRVLSKMPQLTWLSLTEGTFTDDFETYLTDQFIFRDEIIAAKAFFERVIGKTRVGGVYIGKDGYLFSEQTAFDEEQVTEITDALSSFAERYTESKITFMLSPNSSYVNSDKLPDNLELPDQNSLILDVERYTESEKIAWLNLSDTFKECEDRESLFYKTDHHWTTRGAYLAFAKLMTTWEKDISGANLKLLPVADGFQGTLSSKSGVTSSSDTVEICVPENSALTYTVTFDGQEEKKTTLFDAQKLEEKNKYEVFLGGNFGKITIDTTSQSKDTLLIVKDSYANCMVPMFTPFFAKIVVVDPRYFTERLSETVDENGFTHILFLYNLNTLLEDSDLADCLTK